MTEPVIRPRRHQIGADERVERRVHRGGLGRDRLQQRNLEAGTDHRRFLDDLSLRGVEPVHAREQQAVQRRGHLRGRGLLGAAPPPIVADQHAGRDQVAHHFLEVQRVAAGPLQDQGAQALREEPRRVPEPLRQQVLTVGPRQRRHLDPGVRNTARVQRLRIERRPVHQEDQERTIGEPVRDRAQHLDGGGVGPVQILDDQHQRAGGEPPLHQGKDGHEDLALELLRLQMAHARVVLVEPEHPGERGHHRRAILRVDPERHQALRELAPRDLDGIAVLHPVGVAQERGYRPVGLLAQRRARRAPDRGALEAPGRLEAREELLLQPRLPRSGLADEAQDLGAPRPRVVEGRFHLAQLALAAHEGRGQAEPRQAARRARRGERAQQAMHHHRLALALEPDLLARGEREGVVRELVRRIADEDVARRRRALQARGGVDGVAGHRVGGVDGPAHPARHHRPGVDPDVQRERPADPPLPAAIERAHALAHQQGRAQAALGIVLVRSRRAEHGHDGVADELLDEPLIALDRRGHLAEEIGLDRPHVLGIEPFAERGESGQVREEHGDRSAVAVGRRGRGGRRRSGREPGSALGAEREVRGRVEAATATCHVDGATSIARGPGSRTGLTEAPVLAVAQLRRNVPLISRRSCQTASGRSNWPARSCQLDLLGPSRRRRVRDRGGAQ